MNIDKTFKNKINQLKDAPPNVKWDKHTNWNVLLNHRRKAKKIRNRRVFMIAASALPLILFSWGYYLKYEHLKKSDFISRQALLRYENQISKDYTKKYIIDFSNEIDHNCTIIEKQDDVIVFK